MLSSIKITPKHIVLYWGVDKYKIYDSTQDNINNILIALRAIQPTKIIIEKPYIKLYGGLNTPPSELIERIELLQGIYSILVWEITTKHHLKPLCVAPNDYRRDKSHLNKYELLEHARALFDKSLPNNELLSLLDCAFMYKYGELN